MYNEFSEKVDHPVIGPLLFSIAQDSLKHSKLFEEISKELIITSTNENQCKKSLEPIWNHITEITKLVKTKKVINSEGLLKIIKRLALVEYQFGEEYSILEQTKMLTYMNQQMTKTYGTTFDRFFQSRKDVLNSIINDEQKHYQTLIEIHELLTEKEPEKDNTPEFKYQTPDAWTFPPPKLTQK